MQFKGVVKEVSSFEFKPGTHLWSFSLNGDRNYYRCGDRKPAIESGQFVLFDANAGNKQGSFNVTKGTIQVKAAEAEATGVVAAVKSTGGSLGKDDYWGNREARDIQTQKRIEKQSCRNSALEFIKILLSQENAVKFGAKADKTDILEKMLAKYTEEFIVDNAGKKDEEPEVVETAVDEVPY